MTLTVSFTIYFTVRFLIQHVQGHTAWFSIAKHSN